MTNQRSPSERSCTTNRHTLVLPAHKLREYPHDPCCSLARGVCQDLVCVLTAVDTKGGTRVALRVSFPAWELCQRAAVLNVFSPLLPASARWDGTLRAFSLPDALDDSRLARRRGDADVACCLSSVTPAPCGAPPLARVVGVTGVAAAATATAGAAPRSRLCRRCGQTTAWCRRGRCHLC